MSDLGAGTGIVEGIGNALGMLGDRLDQNRIQQAKQRDLLANHLEDQAREIGDNIMRVGGFEAPEAAPLVAQLKQVTERHNALFPPHESGKLIQRLQKFIGHNPAPPQQDARATLTPEDVLARARRPEFKDTRAGQIAQAKTNIDIGGMNADAAEAIKQKNNDATIEWAKKHGIDEDQIKDLQAVLAGIPATLLKPPAEKSGQWKVVSGNLANGDAFSYKISGNSGKITDLYGNEVPKGYLDGFKEAPKGTPKPKQAWSRDADGRYVSVMLDANNQKIKGTENYDVIPPASIVGRVTTGQYHWVDEDGNVHSTEETRTSRPMEQGGGAAPPQSAPSVPPAGTPAVGSAPASNQPSAAPKPAPAAGIPKTPAEARSVILGNKGTPAITDARKNLDTAKGLMTKAQDAWDHHSATNDKTLVISLIRDAAGRFNKSEYDALISKAGFGNTLEAYANSITTGELPIDIRRQLVDAARNNLAGAQSTYDAAKKPANQMTTGGAAGGGPIEELEFGPDGKLRPKTPAKK